MNIRILSLVYSFFFDAHCIYVITIYTETLMQKTQLFHKSIARWILEEEDTPTEVIVALLIPLILK